MDQEAYWLTEGQTIQVDVPVDAVVAYGGATRNGDTVQMEPPAVGEPLPAADLVWGRFRLGRFVMDSVAGRIYHDRPSVHYLATLRRAEQTPGAPREPVDDEFAAYLKRHRDELDPDSHAWIMVDGILDDYRDHRVTGTPLDQEVEIH